MPQDITFGRNEEFDVVIATCGYERRSSYLCRLGVRGREKLAIVYPDTDGGSFSANLTSYQASDWALSDLKEALRTADAAWSSGAASKVAIDISSMPREIIGRVVKWLSEAVHRQPLDVHFIYCPGEFGASARAATVVSPMSAGPISPFYAGLLRAPSIPIGLVVGLGLEPHRAAGVIELLEPARTWLFSAAMGDNRFEKASADLHSSILGSTSPHDAFAYDVRSLVETYSMLESLAFGVSLNYRLIFAPSGPKLFALACLLIGAERDAERPAVWRVGSTKKPIPMDVEEAGEVCAAVVRFGTQPSTASSRD